MRRRFTAADDEAQIDLTPMLDVVFIMLIFFIVTSSFAREKGWEITRPDQNQQQQQDPDPDKKNILITITANNQLKLNRYTSISVASVGANISRLLAENSEASVVVQAQKGAKINTYTAVHDAAIQAGVAQEKVVMITSE